MTGHTTSGRGMPVTLSKALWFLVIFVAAMGVGAGLEWLRSQPPQDGE
jgi:hypothetical protein